MPKSHCFYSLTRFCLSSIVEQVATMAPSPRPKGDISETTFIELTHTAIDFLAKSANILESAVDLNDSSSVDRFLASANSYASVRALLHSFRTDSPFGCCASLVHSHLRSNCSSRDPIQRLPRQGEKTPAGISHTANPHLSKSDQ